MAKPLYRKPGSSKGRLSLGRSVSRLSTSLLETEPTEDLTTSHSYSHLSNLRTRTRAQSRPTPEQTNHMIKTYLLPLFEPSRSRSRLLPSKHSVPGLDAVPGTVYGELKLASMMCEQVEALKKELVATSEQLQDALQAKEAASKTTSTDQARLVELHTDCQLLRFSLAQTLRSVQLAEAKASLSTSQISAYQKLYEAADAEKKQLATLLHESKAMIDKLQNRALQLEHGNMLLALENSVIGERLKGLYATLQSISSARGNIDKLEAEFELVSATSLHSTDYLSSLHTEIQTLILRKDELFDMNVMLVSLRNEDHIDKTRLATQSRDKIVQLSTELTALAEAKEDSATLLEKSEKKLKETADENQRLRVKMKNSRLKRKANDTGDLICKVCQKMFNEMDNFNWSCRTHFGDFGGEMWWCCGKSGRDAPGCKVAKHVSKEDEDEEDPSQKSTATLYCLSCKDIGHRYSECPKDPNIRSKQDLGNELKRIHDIKERKKAALQGFESHSMMKSLFADRFGSSAFGVEEGQEDDSSEEDQREEWEIALEKNRQQSSSVRRDYMRVDSQLKREPTLLRLLERNTSDF